ncbi:hypothetical protein A3J61_01100 [Candidatus Nomurabacteria bacterium RIFCSPHIGHO2_02_FULL_38_15]|uniref:Uncharacterized protein n=1 Tax=Candidatus Nomurabacteria bacterium RIFCSPHIGHO2_02_FULL_38_15 TaxID=1801752 RepID=A0A1F6VSK5_9BACT|nr:MAG: hypothetical protein A3J61_01100 [Candidatus Nomurabacteria bacterium RIFCSPHIGHO2_02_FULL_38_15]
MKKIKNFIVNLLEFFYSLYGSFKHRNNTGVITTVYSDQRWNSLIKIKSLMKQKYGFIKILHKDRVNAWGSIRYAYKVESWEPTE